MSITARTRSRLKDPAWWSRYAASLQYALYVVVHPFDGFWDLTHEKRGTLAAANTIIALVLITRILKLEFTSFQFITVNWEYVNVFEQWLSILIPLLIWCAANWGLTTLFDGKGTLKDIYIAMGYAFTPYLLLQVPMIFVSNVITFKEGVFWMVLNVLTFIWAAYLVIVAMMEIHDYTIGKTLLFVFVSLFGMMVIIFLLLLFLSLITDGVGYFVSLYREIVFRLY